MSNRKRINLERFAPFVIEHEGRSYDYADCFKFAEIANMGAGIFQTVMKTREKKYFWLTVVSNESERNDAYGIHDGWYSTSALTEDEARKFRRSWAVLREQPGEPTGPWAG